MDRIIETVQKIITGSPVELIDIWYVIFRVLLFISVCCFVGFTVQYLVKFKIFHVLFAKITGNARKYDRIRREQLKKELANRENAFAKEEKESFMSKLYAMIAKTGIVEKIPGFSEAGFLIIVSLILFVLFIVLTYYRGIIVGLAGTTAVSVAGWYCLSIIVYNRKMKLERQLLHFTNACASASMQYPNIIDIFGDIYEQFSEPLKDGLETCYVEAKQTSNKLLALKHLKDKYYSTDFSFIIDNLELCSANTGDYTAAARDIAEMVAIHNESYENKRVILRKTKIKLTILFVIGIGIMFALSLFLGNIKYVLFQTTLGNLAIIALILLYFYGINLKAEK